MYINVHIVVTERRRLNMRIVEMQVREQAEKAVRYFTNGGKKNGGNALKHKQNPYGIALKYIFITRDLTYEDVANKLQITPQAVNHIVNRMKKKCFNEFYVDKLCDKLCVDSGYFKDLVGEIGRIMEVK